MFYKNHSRTDETDIFYFVCRAKLDRCQRREDYLIRNPTFQGELGDSTFLKVQSTLIISIFRLIEFIDISNNYPGPRLIILVLEHRKHIIPL